MNPPLRLLSVFPSSHAPQWIVSVPEHDAWAAASPINRYGWMLLLPDWGGCVRLTPLSIRRGRNYRGNPLPKRVQSLVHVLADTVEQGTLPDRLCIAICSDSPAGPRRDYAYQQVMHTLSTNIRSALSDQDVIDPSH